MPGPPPPRPWWNIALRLMLGIAVGLVLVYGLYLLWDKPFNMNDLIVPLLAGLTGGAVVLLFNRSKS